MICPFLSQTIYYPIAQTHDVYWKDCQQDLCQLWLTAETVEGQTYSNCAIVLNALKNSEGKIII